MKIIRGIITKTKEGYIKLVDAAGRARESFINKEFFQQYGFTSRPLAGAEVLLIKQGNIVYVVASDDRRYRLAIEDGEVAIFTDEGDKVHLKKNKEIEIKSGNKVTVDATTEVLINSAAKVSVVAPAVDIVATTTTITSTAVLNVVAPGVNLGASAGGKSLLNEDFLTLFNTHTHGAGAVPDQQAGAEHKTVNTKAI